MERSFKVEYVKVDGGVNACTLPSKDKDRGKREFPGWVGNLMLEQKGLKPYLNSPCTIVLPYLSLTSESVEQFKRLDHGLSWRRLHEENKVEQVNKVC